MTILADLSDLLIEHVSMTNEVTITVRAASPTASCPCCGVISQRIHSHYLRTLRDLPASGRPVHLMVQVRRFFCQESTCVRKIFAERFPSLTLPRVKFTLRLREALCQLGFALGGEAGTRLGRQLSIPGSPDTILRLIKRTELPPAAPPRVVGIDDWSWKRRLRYGTLLCDLERSIPIDLLPDRSVETVSTWFKKHPSIEVISRDGSSEYAAAASKGAPQAVQVADRWHVVKNLGESLSTLLARCRAESRRATCAQTIPEEEQREQADAPHPYRSRKEEQARLARRAERQARYAQVMFLRQQGESTADIAFQVGMGERTVRDWLAHGSYPEPRRRRPSLIDRYESYVLKRWNEGCHSGAQLYQELRAQGYHGSERAMYRYLSTLRPTGSTPRKGRTAEVISLTTGPLDRLSLQRTTWLFFRKATDLDETQQEALTQIRQASPHIETAYQLVQAFMEMVRERTGQLLDGWLKAVEVSDLSEFSSFARGVELDKEAVLAGLTLPWSNGPTEGHINRLKLIKRSMYGRAKFPLLRARVLHMAERGAFSHRLMPLDGDALHVAERRFKKGEQLREQEEHDGAIDPIWEDIS